jgi:hypothetical protein
MGVSVVLYFASGMVFLLLPRPLLTVLDSFAAPFHLATVLPGAMPAERFWILLAFAMTMTITSASVMVVRDPSGNRDFCIPVMFSKTASWLSALVYFALVSRAFAHLVIFIVDFPLFVITLVFYRRARMAAK